MSGMRSFGDHAQSMNECEASRTASGPETDGVARARGQDNNSLTNNKYCFCRDYIDTGALCLICASLSRNVDHRSPGRWAARKKKVVITGAVGKTTTTHLLGHVLMRVLDDGVGMASSVRVMRGGADLRAPQQRASEHYTFLLNQPDLGCVVSEQPLAGLSKYGLPIAHDFGVITNIPDDHHLEKVTGRHTLTEIYQLKALVGRMAVRGWSTSIDYEWTRKMIDDLDRPPSLLVGKDPAWVARFTSRGFTVLTARDGFFCLVSRSETIPLASVESFQPCLGGALDHGVENLLHVMAVLYTVWRPLFPRMLEVLQSTPPSFDLNPGRSNVFWVGARPVLAEHVHNPIGYDAVFRSVERLVGRMDRAAWVGLIEVSALRTSYNIRKLVESLSRARNARRIYWVARPDVESILPELEAACAALSIPCEIWRGSALEFSRRCLGDDDLGVLVLNQSRLAGFAGSAGVIEADYATLLGTRDS